MLNPKLIRVRRADMTQSEINRRRNDSERVVGKCSLCGGNVVDGKEFVQAHCRGCGAVPKNDLPTIEMEPKEPRP